MDNVEAFRKSLIAYFEKLKESAPTLKDMVYLDGVLAVIESHQMEGQQSVDVDSIIGKIPVDKANFEHIAQTGKINGSLLVSLREILNKKS